MWHCYLSVLKEVVLTLKSVHETLNVSFCAILSCGKLVVLVVIAVTQPYYSVNFVGTYPRSR